MSDTDLQVRAEKRIGMLLCGKYRIDGVLGVGGMAVVYAATHRNQKRVAIKMLHPEFAMHEEVRARFLREGYAANTVDHPGAVAVLDDNTAEDGATFLVMERLEGEEVDRLSEQRGQRLPVDVVLAIANQLLDVLAAAHAKSIIHRDIKPANLYITTNGTLKVLDFGIARLRDAAAAGRAATGTGMMLGTPAYMAPEQALGKSREIDETTDNWSVGATMFSLLSGQFVHEGESATELVVRSATEPARSLAVVAPEVDGRVVEIVDRALAFEKRARWPNAFAMRDAVRAAYLSIFGVKVGKEPLERIVAGRPEGTGEAVPVNAVPPTAQSPRPSAAIPPAPVPHAEPTREMTARPSAVAVRPAPPAQTPGPAPTRDMMAIPLPADHLPAWPAAAQTGRTSGVTTSEPVSTDSPMLPAGVPSRGSSIALVIAAAFVVVLGVGGTFAWRLRSSSSPPTTSMATTGTPPSAPSESAPSVAPPPAAARPAPSGDPSLGGTTRAASAPEAEAIPASAVSAGTPASRAPSTAPAAHRAGSSVAVPMAPLPPTPAAAASPLPRACRTVSYFDSDGTKRFKQECP
jgi:serine/threonine-protein kinase